VKLPEFAGPAEHLDYLALLDRCLLDRQLSEHETSTLVLLAEQSGIGRGTCRGLHQLYFDELTAIAWADGELSTDEIVDLDTVARMLGLPPEAVVRAMQDRASGGPTPSAAPHPTLQQGGAGRFRLAPGALVVLTGAMSRGREDWHRDLRSGGFVPWSAVTKKVSLLVAADIDSFSGKARKARDYGIPVVDEAWLARLLTP
jgi:DNA polymerase-3 subunit epsilon